MSAILQSAPCRAISCESEITTGDIWTGLTDLMRRHATELLVMGTVGRRGFRKILLGSVAEEAMRESSCPVLTVGPHIQSTDNISFRHVLYASDFSDDSLAGVRYAFDISEKYAARLTLVHALEGFPESPYLEAQMATVQLRKLISTRPRLPVVPDIVVEMGSAASVILEAAKKVGADLIVIGVRGAGSLPRLATHFGSVAHKIVCGAGCPVLTVRRLQEPRQ